MKQHHDNYGVLASFCAFCTLSHQQAVAGWPETAYFVNAWWARILRGRRSELRRIEVTF